MRGLVLLAGGEVYRTFEQEGEVAGAAGITAEFGVFAPSDVAAVLVGAFHAPMTADAGEPVASENWNDRGVQKLERGLRQVG